MKSLKRGQGISTFAKDWRDPSAEWEFWPVYLPNGAEKYQGDKEFNGIIFCVFRCHDDSFYAQPESTVLEEMNKDPMAIQSILPNLTLDGIKQKTVKEFIGTNWKLSSDRKWKSKSMMIPDTLQSVGEKTIDGVVLQVYKLDGSFIAFC